MGKKVKNEISKIFTETVKTFIDHTAKTTGTVVGTAIGTAIGTEIGTAIGKEIVSNFPEIVTFISNLAKSMMFLKIEDQEQFQKDISELKVNDVSNVVEIEKILEKYDFKETKVKTDDKIISVSGEALAELCYLNNSMSNVAKKYNIPEKALIKLNMLNNVK